MAEDFSPSPFSGGGGAGGGRAAFVSLAALARVVLGEELREMP